MAAFFFCGPLEAMDSEGRKLFENFYVEIRESALTLLEGPSGSGKSTLLRQLAGLDAAPPARRQLIDREYSPSEMPEWRSRVTLMSQDAPILDASVEKNLIFPYQLKVGQTRTPDQMKIRELMARVGLEEIPLQRRADKLSGGERHRLALVRALLWDPPILLADEALSGLDAARAGDCFRLLLDFAHRPGHAVLSVLHDESLGSGADERIRIGGGER